MAVTVGVIANPASGRDIRRLVSGASVFDNAEKGHMIFRLLVGLAAVGVEQALLMPAGSGVAESLERSLHGRAADQPCLPEIDILRMPIRNTAEDSREATRLMREQGVSAIVVLGGDGTHRVVAGACGDVPLCALSTGTNNAFPEVREATIAGLATGLVAIGRVTGDRVLRREKTLRVTVAGSAPREECALVDVAVSSELWVGSRALWRPETISEVFVAFAQPGAVGLSGVAGLVEPVPRSAHYGLHLRLTAPAGARQVVQAPLAPGLIVPVGIAEQRRIAPGEVFSVASGFGCLAVDGEREIELTPGDRAEIRLDAAGPLTIDIDAVLTRAAEDGLLAMPR